MNGLRPNRLTVLAVALVVATPALSCRQAGRQFDPKGVHRPSIDNNPTRAGLRRDSAAPKLVSFPTPDKGLIYANEYGQGDHGVVLAHGGRFNKESWDLQPQALARAGLRILAIDFRGYGRSKGPSQARNGYYFDILGAVRYLRETAANAVSVVGGSFGGGAAARASVEAKPGEIDRLVLLAHSSIEQPEGMKGRKLFITAREDFSGNGVLRLPRIREQYEKTPEPKKLIILDGSAHAQHIFGTEQGERLMQEILHFLSEP